MKLMPSTNRTYPPLRRVLSESLANVRARPALSCAVIGLLFGVLCACLVAEWNAVIRTRLYAAQLEEQGYTVLRVGSEQQAPERLRVADCHGLGKQEGVTAALWLDRAEDARWFSAGGPPVPVRRIGGDVFGFLSAVAPRAADHWNGAPLLVDTASELARSSSGAFLVTVSKKSGNAPSPPVLALFTRLTMLGGGLEGNALQVSDAPEGNGSVAFRPVESCLLLVRQNVRLDVKARTSLAFPASRGYSSQWVMPNADAFETPRARFQTRPSRWFWLGGAIVSVSFWSLYLRLRRSELGVYAASGLNFRRITVLLCGELGLLVVLAVLLATVVLTGAAVHAGLDPTAADTGLRAGARYLIATVGGSALASAAVGERVTTAILQSLKDR